MPVGPVESITILGVWLKLGVLLGSGGKNRGDLPSSDVPRGSKGAGGRLAPSGTPPGRGSRALKGLTEGEDLSPQQQPQQRLARMALPCSSCP